MVETVPKFSIKEVESFWFHLHFIYKRKTKQRFATLKNARKICSTRKWKFYNILQKTWYEAWRTLFSILVLMKLKAFAFICTISIRARLNIDSSYFKTLEKFVQLANENFTTFCKNDLYESWRTLFPIFVLPWLCTLVIRPYFFHYQIVDFPPKKVWGGN